MLLRINDFRMTLHGTDFARNESGSPGRGAEHGSQIFPLTGEIGIQDNWLDLRGKPFNRDRHRLICRMAYVLNAGL